MLSSSIGILDMVGKEPQLRSKRDLIEKFISENMPQMAQSDDMSEIKPSLTR
jgi:type I restriction enzyme R subunit